MVEQTDSARLAESQSSIFLFEAAVWNCPELDLMRTGSGI
jgi:hypothetical protein